MHLSYILQLSIMILSLFIITTSQVKAQQGQDSHGLTPEQVKQFCRSDNPRLNFVNQRNLKFVDCQKALHQPQHQTHLGHPRHHQEVIPVVIRVIPVVLSSGSSSSSSGSSPSSSGSSPSSSGSSPSSSGSITPTGFLI